MGGKTRVRRSAEEARAVILDAAEAQLRLRGPDSLRLTALAKEVGMSHPAILHHFGSREGLMKAVIRRTTERLEKQIYGALSGDLDEAVGATLLDRLFRALGDPGNARVLAWLALARDQDGDREQDIGTHLRDIATAIHARRCARKPTAEPPFEDTLFAVLLAGLAVFGNAVAGPALLSSAGLAEDPDADRRFIVWLARRLHAHLDS